MENKREIGAKYERAAGRYLESLGYEISEYNFHSRYGEIDIIARHEGYLVFVEVKYRSSDREGHPLEAVSEKKRRSVCRCALYYMMKNHIEDTPVRFDAVGILGERIRVVRNAFPFEIGA